MAGHASIALLVHLSAFSLAASEETACSCDRTAKLEAEVAELKRAFTSLEALVLKQAPVTPHASGRAKLDPSTKESRVRQLNANEKRVWHGDALHSFPDPTSCFGAANYDFVMLNRLESGEISVRGTDEATEVERISPPLKVLHDAACTAAPTLALQV